jgi:allantoin racemase
MRVLLLNPNTTEAVTQRLLAAAKRVSAPGTEIVPLTASKGVPYIATRAEAQIAGAIVLEMLAAHQDVDAAIIAAFGDPGLMGARELFDFPVIGMSEAAMLTACMLGGRFAIVTFAQALGPWYRECVESHGLTGRLASIRMLDESFKSIKDVQEEKAEQLVALANQAAEDGADAVILAGAPLAGMANEVRTRIKVPVIDQTEAALRQAETLVLLNPRKSTLGSFRRPDAKPTQGLSDALAQRIEHRDGQTG